MSWEEFLSDNVLPSIQKIVPTVYEVYSIGHSSQKKNYCSDCNVFWDSEAYSYRSNPCPSCGNEFAVASGNHSSLPGYWLYVHPDTKEFFCFQIEIKHNPVPVPDEDTTSFQWLKGSFSYEPKIVFTGTYAKKLAFSDEIRKNTNEWFKRAAIMKMATLINGEDFDLANLLEVCPAKRTAKNLSANEVEARNFDAPAPDIEYFKSHSKIHLTKEMVKVRNTKKYKIYCARTGKSSEFFSSDYSMTCPFCANDSSLYYYNPNSRTESFVYFDTTENKTLVARQFKFTVGLTGDKIKTSLNEEERVFFFKNEMFYFAKEENGYKKVGLGSFLTGWSTDIGVAVQTPEEIADIIRNSSMHQTGLLEAWGLVEGVKGIEPCGNIKKNSYITMYHKRPVIEKLLKTGLLRLTNELIHCSNDEYSSLVDTTATTLTGALGVTKPELKLLKQLDSGQLETIQIKVLYKLDNALNYDLFVRMKLGGNNVPYEFADIREKFGYSYQMQLDYLDNAYNNQCIERREAISIWHDYLDMAKKLHYRLDNANTKFPSSLKKEHDRAMFTYRAFKEKISREQFELKAKENSKYEYSKGDYMAIVPKLPEEVVCEGNTLKHCVASYVNRIADGDTCIVFIRRKDAPDIPFYTAEVKGGYLIQIRGYTNKTVSENAVKEFVNSWCRAKNIVK